MKTLRGRNEKGSTFICAVCTIAIISLIGANVLMNATTRYNMTTKQVKGWKEALYAAEAGGDIAFSEVRKVVSSPGNQFTGTGWTTVDSTHWTYTMPAGIGDSNTMTSTVAVDNFTSLGGNPMYRIRSVGTARVYGLRRTGMSDGITGLATNFAATGARGDGDNLLRKIDFNYDHFMATYGDGDGNYKHQQAVPTDASGNPLAQVSRRIELIAVPTLPITGALLASGGFNSGGGVIDSYDSKNGAYPGNSTATNPAAPYYSDSRDANVVDGGSTWNQGGYIYGSVTTNGGNASTARISGVVDNNVPVTQAVQPMPTGQTYQPTVGKAFTPIAGSSYATGPWYLFSSLTGASISNPSGTAETYVNVVVTGDLDTTMTVARGVNVRFYFTGDLSIKGKNFNNNNVDGSPSTNPSRAGHVQFYGISPTAPATQSLNMSPPGDIQALVYAPGGDFHEQGNNDFYGAIVCKTFSGNGSTGFHFDKELGNTAAPLDYRIASYVEDVR